MKLITGMLSTLLLLVGFATLKSQNSTHRTGKAQRMEQRADHHPNKEARAALHSDLKAYHQEEILPTKIAARTALDREISEQDRKEIDRLRALLATRPRPERGDRPSSRAAHLEKRAAFKEAMKKWRTSIAPDREKLFALADKYAAAIDAQLAVLKTNAADWKAGRRAIIEEHLGEGSKVHPPRRHHRHHRHRADQSPGMRKPAHHHQRHEGEAADRRQKARIGLLLLDPLAAESRIPTETAAPGTVAALAVAPNPLTGSGTIRLEVAEESSLLIQLFNDNGQLVRSYGRLPFTAGKHQLPLDVSGLPAGAYRLSASSQHATTSTPLIINQ